jgi:hypothetical protein
MGPMGHMRLIGHIGRISPILGMSQHVPGRWDECSPRDFYYYGLASEAGSTRAVPRRNSDTNGVAGNEYTSDGVPICSM